jgi:uncharacterized protein YijF (DUF1287 family)
MRVFLWLAAAALTLASLPWPAPARADPPTPRERVLARARDEVARKVTYDAAYFKLTFKDGVDTKTAVYPGGDLTPDRGVCTDVVIRGLRAVGIDLQKNVHEDILRRRKAYSTVDPIDRNIDHRRVGPVLTFLKEHARPLGSDPHADAGEWQPADIVVWTFHTCPRCSPDHIGFVSDKLGPRGIPLIIHNVGPIPSETDDLDAWPILGHFRLVE